MNIVISNSSDKPIYLQIVNQIKDLIISKKLCEDEALPSMRCLAKDLRISVITTKRAYEELEKEGFIYTVTGKGSFVARQNVELIKEHELKKVQDFLLSAVDIAKKSNITLDEMIDILNILYEE